MINKINFFQELDYVLNKFNLHKNDICIVGSSVLAIHNIRKNNDIDIIIKQKIRNSLFNTNTKVTLSTNVEIVSCNWLNIDDFDDKIINNQRYHDRINGYKVAKIEILYLHKSISKRTKSLRDKELILKYLKAVSIWDRKLYLTLLVKYSIASTLKKVKLLKNFILKKLL